MESDERFKHLATDPRFKTLRRKKQKIKIDDRFQSMFTDKKFTLKYTKDKRGRDQKKTSGDDLRRYYYLDDEKKKKKEREVEEAIDEDLNEETDLDEEESVEDITPNDERETQDDDETDTELSSSSDESESDVEDQDESDQDEDAVDVAKIKYNWQPLDHDAEKADASTRRLAIQNLDWDHLDIKDVYTLMNSIRPPLNVKLYISEFGKERLAKEDLQGPQEIVEMPKEDEIEEEYNQLRDKMRRLKNQGSKSYKVNQYEDADEEMDPKNEEIRERVRRYQLNRMKYFYAVAEFDSVESAELVYKELDGMEYEGSSLELDLRFVPDDMELDPADVKAECDKIPDLASYKAPQFINTALQQTTVKFTWDETDSKRQDKLRRAHTKEELERDDLEVYLASESDSELEDEEAENGPDGDAVSVVTANSEARAKKYQMLLKSLDEEAGKKKKVEVDVEWGDFSDDEKQAGINQDELASDEFDSNDESLSDEESEIESPPSPQKRKGKNDKKHNKKKRKRTDEDESKEDNELDLIVMDVDSKGENFKFNPDDDRFKAVYESGVYNIDPSHPNFKRTEAFDVMAERKRQRRQGLSKETSGKSNKR